MLKRIEIITLILLQSIACMSQTYSDSIAGFRENYLQDFLREERSPIHDKENLKYIQFFDADSSYRVTASFMKTENASPFEMQTLNGKTKTYVEYGSISFSLGGRPFVLKIYQSISLRTNPEYKNHLFLPFNDDTNGDESYAAGRYIDLSISDIVDGNVEIDFNKAYNPYCAYSAGYSCPKPPDENYLPIEVRAGEKKYAKESH